MHDIDGVVPTVRVADEDNLVAGEQWLDRLELRSPDPQVCPFLRALDERDQLAIPIAAPDALNRCAALHDAIPQSLRQQELVCLTSGHVNCPRYLRGAMAASEPARRSIRPRPVLRRPTI